MGGGGDEVGHLLRMDSVLPFELCKLRPEIIREWGVLVGCHFNTPDCNGHSLCFIFSLVVFYLIAHLPVYSAMSLFLLSSSNTSAPSAQISPALPEHRREIRLD